MRIDIFAVDDDDAAAIECKSRLLRQDVDEFLEKLSRFKRSFRHFNAYRVYGVVAGIEIDQNVDR
ncbi:MAG: hypothetical protein AAFU78_08825 [Cyanobacteria bacterium J06633_2]